MGLAKLTPGYNRDPRRAPTTWSQFWFRKKPMPDVTICRAGRSTALDVPPPAPI